MEQFIKQYELILISIAVFAVWFSLNCVNNHFKNKWLYMAELTVLMMNIICDICLAVFSGITTETVEISIQLIAMAVVCGAFAMLILKDFYQNCYGRKYRK